jgi:tetratricopeptide (TPR) repeat protein
LWDDDAHVTRADLRSATGLGRIWAEVGATPQYYPLLHSAFWLEYRLFKDNPVGYHAINLGLHATNALLLGWLVRQLGLRGAWLAAGIFALHPVMVESVAWISELKNTLSGLFYFSAALAYLRFDRRRTPGAYALALGLFAAALGSKTVTATLPGALLVVLWWQRGAVGWRRDVVPLLPFFALGAASGLFSAWVEVNLIGASGSDFVLSIGQRVLIAGRAICFYFAKLVWPANLTFIYPRWEVRTGEAWQFLFPASVAIVLIAFWCWRRHQRGPLAAALVFIGTLLPVLGAFDIYPFQFSFVADHFQYLASVAVIAPAAWLMVSLGERIRRRGASFVGFAVLAPLCALTSVQSRTYGDAETLYRATLRNNPACWLAHVNLGQQLHEKRRFDDAIAHYAAALAIKPGEPQALYSRGCALVAARRFAEAIQDFEGAIERRPGYVKAHYNLGLAYGEIGQRGAEERHLRAAVDLQPNSAQFRRSLGEHYLEAGRGAEAARELAEAVRLAPSDVEARGWLEKLAVRGYPPPPRP